MGGEPEFWGNVGIHERTGMSGIIARLPEHVSNQIAAGEVIQRPASVVKELMENAVDAGALVTEVHVLDAGRTSIQVLDNGSGMSPSDAKLCFERHATSKLQTADDLFQLSTKGFRGEALASVSSIAHVDLTTRRSEDEVGIHLKCHGSSLVEESPKACAVGSVFQVRNLFYNVPARRNFLKSDAVEFRHIVDEFQRVAFAHPELSFTLTHQGAVIFQLKPGTFRQRVVGILGPKHDERLVPVSEETDVVQVDGFVGKPDSARRTRGEQFLFVNGRFVRHGLLHRAILRAYDGLIAEGQQPLYTLRLKVNPARVDVNIHPTKMEVKFDEEQAIVAILKSAVRRGLGAHNVAPSIDFDVESGLNLTDVRPGTVVSEPQIQIDPSYNPFVGEPARTASQRGVGSSSWGRGSSDWPKPSSRGWKELAGFFEQDEGGAPESTSKEHHASVDMSTSDSGWEVMMWKGKYLVVPTSEGLTVVHARRAQLRILYERHLSALGSSPRAVVSQRLLMPERLTLSKAEVMALGEVRDSLVAMGLDLRVADETTVELHALPSDMTGLAREAVDAVLESFHEGPWEQEEARSVAWAKSWAQHAAMSGAVQLPASARRQLIADLWACEQPRVDPWGRTIMTHLQDVEENFQ